MVGLNACVKRFHRELCFGAIFSCSFDAPNGRCAVEPAEWLVLVAPGVLHRFLARRSPRSRQRWRLSWHCAALVAFGLAVTLFCGSGVQGLGSAAALPQPGPAPPARLEPLRGGADPLGPGVLQLGAYVTVIDGINILDNNFGAEFFLWTRWAGSDETNPSDRLTVLNAPSDNNIDRFELLERRQLGDVDWSLYKVRCRLSMPWRLQDYPFDRHNLLIRIGMANPLLVGINFAVDKPGTFLDPEFLVYDWNISPLRIDVSAHSLRSHLGLPGRINAVSSSPVVDLSLVIRRRSELALLSTFLGDFLAIGLCMLALIIRTSRDDLILGAIFSAAGNSVFLAQLLPVSALSGFAGQIQVIIYLGILYVVIADELLTRVFSGSAESMLRILRQMLLPSYVLATIFAMYWITPANLSS